MTRFSAYDEELKINTIEDNSVYGSGDKLKKYIPNIEDRDVDNFVIVKGKLLYIGLNEMEEEAIRRLGLDSISNSEATKRELRAIMDGVIELKDKYESQVPKNDDDKINDVVRTDTSEGIIGTRLYDRTKQNVTNDKWNIVIEYNKDNVETERYGSGYYLLEKGENYKINGTELLFTNNYVINYQEKDYEIISENAINWNVKSTMGVSDNLPLNLDAMKLAGGEWREGEENPEEKGKFYDFYAPVVKEDGSKGYEYKGIQKFSDVEYDETTKALKFNESPENATGEGGYVRLKQDGVRVKNGFTFEYYGQLAREWYKNKLHKSEDRNDTSCGILMRNKFPILTTNKSWGNTMRVMMGSPGIVGDFCNFQGWTGKGLNMETRDAGDVYMISSDSKKTFESYYKFKSGEDVCFSIVYLPYEENELKQDLYDDFMKENKTIDKIEYFLNGKLYGYTYYSHDKYIDGLKIWDNDEYDFFIGVCMQVHQDNLFYLKGDCYSLRLYTRALTEDEVELNYNTNVKYRNSFKDEVLK